MTIQHHDEQSDVDISVVEHQAAPETETMGDSTATETETPTVVEAPNASLSSETPAPAEAPEAQETHSEPTLSQPETQDALVREDAPQASEASVAQDFSQPELSAAAPLTESATQTEAETAIEPVASLPESIEESIAFASTEAPAEEIRPFTAFIEEFRQAEEARLSTSLSEGQSESFPVEFEEAASFTALAEDAGTVDAVENIPLQETVLAEMPEKEAEISTTSTPEETSSAQLAASTPTERTERPVSPLLRPATRLRLPRHNVVRPREESVTHAAQTEAIASAPSAPATQAALPETTAEPTPPKPARRYRFDRPAASNGAVTSAAQPRTEDLRNPVTSGRTENGYTNGNGITAEAQPKAAPVDSGAQTPEAPAAKQVTTQEPATAESTTTAPSPITEQDRRRRHSQERPREKEQAAAATTPPETPSTPTPATPVAEVTAPPEPMTRAEEVALEDLPPLEYAELQKASSRRRRRHRSSPNGAPTSVAHTPTAKAVTPAPAVEQPAVPEVASSSSVPSAPSTPSTPTILNTPPAPVAPGQYGIVSGYTVGQMNQGSEVGSPFMGPDPSPARGSVFSRDGRNTRAEAQRTPVYAPRPAEGNVSSTSIQQLASVLAQAIQTQSDRMVAELRRVNQQPPSVSVTLPPFPSTERVGVFVDVANLLYSARTLRIGVDFGKLLDFLRGNRRLVRAHAYCPTSPQAGDEQMFLQAVKGLGYRITTKNYKTFSSGAKKADLDLDLCMDVVRLVDGNAVDCIVLVSGDSDFMPMLDYCSDHGVRVEVAAFDEAMSATLRQSCDLFINLSMLEEIRS